MSLLDCRAITHETFKFAYLFKNLFVYLTKFTLIFMNNLIQLLKYAVVIKLPENEISSICDTFTKITEWKCIILDLSFNLLKNLENKCFSTTQLLKSLQINDNHIISLGKQCAHNLTKSRYLDVMNNPLIHLHDHFLIQASHSMLF